MSSLKSWRVAACSSAACYCSVSYPEKPWSHLFNFFTATYFDVGRLLTFRRAFAALCLPFVDSLLPRLPFLQTATLSHFAALNFLSPLRARASERWQHCDVHAVCCFVTQRCQWTAYKPYLFATFAKKWVLFHFPYFAAVLVDPM